MSRVNVSSIAEAVTQALSQGYQLSPDALTLLRQLLSGISSQTANNSLRINGLVNLAIEEKARERAKSPNLSTTITAEDLVQSAPDVFEGVRAEIMNEEQKHHSSPSDAGKPGITPTVLPMKDVSPEVEVVRDPSEKIQPTGHEGFAQLFKNRYDKILRILMERPEGRQLTKISKVNMEKGSTRIAGLVFSKRPTKNGIEFTVDDDTGRASVLALEENAKALVDQVAMDQCIMLDVEAKQGRLLLKNVIQPDVPNRLSSTSKKTVYAVFLSDIHIGSDKFLSQAFDRFLDWIAGRQMYTELDEEIIRRLKYIVIGGDVVDGVGVFPNQEYELTENNIYKQYDMVAEKLKSIPEHLRMLVIPGNHDSTRQALPQPMIPKKYASSLYNLKNVTMLGDPSLIKLHGVSVLVYHGRSLDDVLATTPGLSYERPTEAMKVLLRARHLAPIFGSRTPIAPELEDHLVIEEVPDIFHAGHVHSVGVESYKSTLIINSGTWQAQTGYQANLGITPRPGLVPIVNLATLDVIFREFLTTKA